MPDTGAPWNIPYVTSTDLVSDWPADSLALANAIASGLDAAGAIKQTVTGANNTTEFTTTSTSFVDAGLSLTITPTSTSSLIVVAATGSLYCTGTGASGEVALVRDSTVIQQTRNVGDDQYTQGWGSVVLDNPATTSAVTYKVQVKRSSAVNVRWNVTSAGIFTISAIEILL